MHPFRAAVETEDFDALQALLAPDVTFFSPVAFTPYHGRALVGAILRGVGRVFEDLVYVRELYDEDGLALVFETRIGDTTVDGVDLLRIDAEGLVSELKVMVRPLSAARAVAAAMSAQFDTIQAEAAAGAGS